MRAVCEEPDSQRGWRWTSARTKHPASGSPRSLRRSLAPTAACAHHARVSLRLEASDTEVPAARIIADHTLGIASLLPRFEGRLFSSDDVPRGKPFPDLFLLAARHFAVMASACLVIEDSASGVAAAVAAGMSVYGFSGNATDERLLAAGANRIFHQMSELPSLLTGAR